MTMTMTKYEPQFSLLGILMMFSFLFMGADCKLGCFRTIRSDLEHYFLPLQKTVNFPIQLAFSNIEEMEFGFKKQAELIHHIKKLNQKNKQLSAENQKKQSLENENQNLKILLNVSRTKKEKLLLAKLVQISADPFSHYVVLDKGKNEGVLENQAIIDTQGVVGLINSVNHESSKVRLITDKAHAVPVQNSRNGLRGIVSGTGKSDFLVLLHTPLSADYQVGDHLVTSGLGGRFPAGYPLGVVSKIDHVAGQAFTRIQVKPIADFSKMNQVLIVTEKLVDIKGLSPEKLFLEVPTQSLAPEAVSKPVPSVGVLLEPKPSNAAVLAPILEPKQPIVMMPKPEALEPVSRKPRRVKFKKPPTEESIPVESLDFNEFNGVNDVFN